MVFDYGEVDAIKRVLVHGAAGNVGAYAVQLARRVAHEVVATALSGEVAYVQTLGVNRVNDVQESRFEEGLIDVDVVLDTIGGDTQDRSFAVLKPGGVLVSAVAAPDQQKAARHGVRGVARNAVGENVRVRASDPPQCASPVAQVTRLAFPQQLVEISFTAVLPD